MISVIVCTYNGERFIIEQLKSIMEQSVMPDEVIIKDDCSSDNTVELCKEFVAQNDLDWKVLVNDRNMGYRLNFISGLKLTNGEIVFLCDQDDCWKKNKVERMTNILSNPNIKSLATTVDRMDEDSNVFEKHLKHPYRKKNGLKIIEEKDFFRFPQYMGMTMAIKREVIDSIDEEYADIITHDLLCNYYSVRMDGLYFLDESLTLRRSIGQNTSYIESQTKLKEKFNNNIQLMRITDNLKILELYKKLDEKHYNNATDILQFNITLLENRKQYIENKSVKGWLKNVSKMFKNHQIKQWLKDFRGIVKQ